MEILRREAALPSVLANALTPLAGRFGSKFREVEPGEVIWWGLAVCIVASTTSRYLGEVSAPLSYALAIGGAGGCGWLWLLARSLFRSANPVPPWSLWAFVAIVAVEAFWAITASAGAEQAQGAAGEIRRIAENGASLICISAVVLVFTETLGGYGRDLPGRERRFRVAVAGCFGAMIAVAFLWAMNASPASPGASLADAALDACAATAVIGGRLAVWFRKRHPLPGPPSSPKRRKAPPAPAALDDALAGRILETLDADRLFATPDLKVADLAARLGERDYKVSQCIAGRLGYRSFTHLVNARRIALAKTLLTDPVEARPPILSVAFDCGFNSIGPFNRAFKQETGMTPSEFRTAAANRA